MYIVSHAAEQFWVSLPCCSPPGGPFPIKSLALSAHVSPRTIHFRVLVPVSGPGRDPSSCNKCDSGGDSSLLRLASLPVGALWPVVRVRRRSGTKGSQLWPLGLDHWQASWPLSTPSGQDVSLSEEYSHQSHHLLQKEGPLPGPETGLLPNTRK